MKLSTAIIIAAATSAPRDAAARSIVTPLSALSTYYEIDVNAADANSIDGLGSVFGRHDLTRKYGGRSYGTASLNLPLLGQIVEEVGSDNVNAVALDAVHRQVQTLRLTGTSPWHTDCEMEGPQQLKPSKNKPLQVGMFLSNTNEDAYFETEDDDLCIPIVAETFVSFDGRVPHRTVVMSGHVDMVGPFSLSSHALLNVAFDIRSEYGANLEGIARQPEALRELSTAEKSNSIGTVFGALVIGQTPTVKRNSGDNFLKVNGEGLPSDCTDDCTMAIALANSRECTEDVHNSAMKVLLQKELFYSTDEQGSTDGWFKQMIDNAESSSPVTLAEFFAAAGTVSTNTSAPVVYLYDKEKSPVACAFLEPLTDEEKEKYDTMFNGEQQDDADAAAEQPAMGGGGGNGAGSVVFLPKFAVSSIMTCALLFLW